MKKSYNLMLLCMLGFGLASFAQNNDKGSETSANEQTLDPAEVRVQHQRKTSQTETAIWSEDFANGIPTTWTNAGFNATGAPYSTVFWEYRGPTTTPTNAVGSRGSAAGSQLPILSATASNGFIIFDSDYLDDNGISGNNGQGSGAAPHLGALTTPTINLSGASYVELRMTCYYRYFEGRALVAFSADGGLTWPDTVQALSVAVNSSTARNELVQINVSNYIGNASNAKLRFIFDGTYDDPGASGAGRGNYYWMIDDISLTSLPKHELQFTEWNSAPPQDIIFGPASGSSKMGYLAKNSRTDQTRDVTFDANAINYGYDTLNNVKLNVKILDANNTLLSVFTSTNNTNLNPGDTANYNDLNTYSTPFKATAVGNYKLVYEVTSDSASVTSDTTMIYVTNDQLGIDFNVFSNSLGTSTLGEDGSALASRIDLVDTTHLTEVWVRISASTVAGGSVEIEVYDTTGFDYVSGFPASSFVGVGTTTYTITPTDVTNGYFIIPVTDGVNPWVELNKASYFIAVRMYSNTGANHILIANDKTFNQPRASSIMYNVTAARWYSGYTNSYTLNAPLIRGIIATGIGIEEDQLTRAISIAPNPASAFVTIRIAQSLGTLDIRMMDISGRIVYEEKDAINSVGEKKIDVSQFPKGVYLLSVSNLSAQTTYKIIVN
jgi:hypothetical protein